MSSEPFFSVIVPTFERHAQLSSCLQALCNLRYPSDRFEVVVVDDGSADSVEPVVQGLSHLMNLKLFFQTNAGPAAARNLGAQHARGEFLAFTDDDCAPDPDWLRALAAGFSRNPDQIVGGRTVNALSYNPYSQTSQLIIDVVYDHFNSKGARFFACNNFAVAANRFRELGGFNAGFITAEDRELCDRWLAQGFSMTYAPNALVYHSHHLTLRTLWRQHFGYGQGARRFHMSRAANGKGRFKPDAGFYLKLLRAACFPGSSPTFKSGALQPMALLLWAQLANLAGFSSQRHL